MRQQDLQNQQSYVQRRQQYDPSYQNPWQPIRRYHHDVGVERTTQPRKEKTGFWAWLMGEDDMTGWRDPSYGDR